MDWITLKREEVENDRMPPVCVHCGAEAKARHNETFEWCPGWVRWLYLPGVLPGAIVRSFVTRRMRLSLPVCPAHRTETQGMTDGAVGWFFVRFFVILLWACLGVSVAYLLTNRSQPQDGGLSLEWALAIGAGAGGIVGGALVLIGASLFARPKGQLVVEEITHDGISLIGVDASFVKAMRELRQGAGLGTVPLDDSKDPPAA